MATDAHAGGHGHSLVQHQFNTLEQQRESNSLGMWAFLITEGMMFGGLFLCYTLFRWWHPGAFEEGSKHLDIRMGTVNTFVLLFSSLSMAMAVHAAGERNKGKMLAMLALTWVLGLTFLVVKGFEWNKDFVEGLVPALNWSFYLEPKNAEHLMRLAQHGLTPDHVQMYYVIYFCMAGLHAVHMIVGLILVGAIFLMGRKGVFTNGNDQPVEIIGLYWHFIDIVWVFLFPLLYLIAGFHPFAHGAG